MSLPIPTLVRRQLRANDLAQRPIDIEEIISRGGTDEPFNAGSSTPYGLGRAIWVATAAAVITLLLLGLIPLLYGSEGTPPAAPQPPVQIPATTVPQSTRGDAEPRQEGGAVVPQQFTTDPSDPIVVLGSLTWRTVDLPAPGILKTGLDDRIYLFAEDALWVSDDGIEWTGYPASLPVGYPFAVGQSRLIGVWGGGRRADSGADEGSRALLPGTVAIHGVPGFRSDWTTPISESSLPELDGEDALSVAIGPRGAVVATSRKLYHSEQGDHWTPIEVSHAGAYIDVVATSGGFYATDGTAGFFSPDGIDWTPIHESRTRIGAVGRWGDTAVADDGETIWRLTPEGSTVMHNGDDRTGPSPWIWQITGSPLGIMAIQADTGRYLFSHDGVVWEDLPLPHGWTINNVFLDEPLAMNSKTILLIASPINVSDETVVGGTRVLMATP